MTPEEAISALDALDTAEDPEAAHAKADEILAASAPFPVRQAYERVVRRSAWWGCS